MERIKRTVSITIDKALYGLTQAEYRVIFACLARSVCFDDSKPVVMMNAILRNYIKGECNLCDSAIDHSLSSLVKKGLLLKNERGIYYLNEKYFNVTSRIIQHYNFG